jgi:hypothetical protein
MDMIGYVILGNLVALASVLATLVIAIYGLCWMVGGPRIANRFAQGVNRTAQRGVRFVGRGTGRTVDRTTNTFPRASGILVIILVIMALSKC